MSVEEIMPSLMDSYFGRSKESLGEVFPILSRAALPVVPFLSSSKSPAKSPRNNNISVSMSYEPKELRLGGPIPSKRIAELSASIQAAIESSILRTFYG